MEFNLSFLDDHSISCLQHAIDGVNKAALLHDPGAWNYVSAGGLIQANKDRGMKPLDPIATTIFDEMEQDGHSGYTAGWTVQAVTKVANNFPKWRSEVLENNLIHMKEKLEKFIEDTYINKFAPYAEKDEEWSVRRSQVLHSLEYSYLMTNLIRDDEQIVLQYLSKMKSVSHLGNEDLFDMIEEHLRV